MKKLITPLFLLGLIFLIGCEKNRRPEIIEIVCSPESGYENTVFKLTGLCQDDDGDYLTYIWTSTSGDFITGENDFEVKWQAPSVATDTTIIVKLSISDGFELVSKKKSIEVLNKDNEIIVTTLPVTDITGNSAVSGGNITYNGDDPITEKGVCWSTDPNPTILNYKTVNGTGKESFVSAITDLQSGTMYYLKAYATNASGTTYGKEVSFQTQNIEQSVTVTTNEISDITETSATSGGRVIVDGDITIIKRGVCWSPNTSPTINDMRTINESGTGSFSSQIAGLNPNTTYYVRAYAEYDQGVTYGNELHFTTSEQELSVVVTTNEVSEITNNSAVSGGRVIVEGDVTIIRRGVCWGKSPSPTPLDNKTINESGPGTFFSYLSELDKNTTYYVRAYADYDQMTVYGNELIFTTLENSVEPDGSFTDTRDGNVYNWVTIGTQVWMQENLAWLPDVSPPTQGSKTEKFYYVQGYYGENVEAALETKNYKEYGVLYNFPASKNACPEGWHLPSVNEWEVLIDYLGGKDVAGGKMKETGFDHWFDPNYGATNSSRFNALGGGDRSIWPDFYYRKETAFFWSSEAFDESSANSYSLHHTDEIVRPYPWNKAYGFSIRCIKNE